ncbi:hypothetical protein QL285_037497 [Trifolium repens]|jgi:hypothetical protein|nr:hypothetical protein QL285_037497 [Trifolium repens]
MVKFNYDAAVCQKGSMVSTIGIAWDSSGPSIGYSLLIIFGHSRPSRLSCEPLFEPTAKTNYGTTQIIIVSDSRLAINLVSEGCVNSHLCSLWWIGLKLLQRMWNPNYSKHVSRISNQVV